MKQIKSTHPETIDWIAWIYPVMVVLIVLVTSVVAIMYLTAIWSYFRWIPK